MRWRSEWLAICALLATSCAFDEGDPWGRADFEATVVFDEAGRAENGKLRTAKNYAVELDRFEIELAAMSVVAGGADGVDFDPANPPEGYSLCHNGHCHADDGSLVDYSDISAELGGASGVEVTTDLAQTVGVDADGETVSASDCGGECELPRGALTTGRIVLRDVVIEGRAFDTLDEPRLPAEGVPFAIRLTGEERLQAPLDGFVGDDLDGDVKIEGELTIPASALDDIDFTDLTDATSEFRMGLIEESTWTTRAINQ